MNSLRSYPAKLLLFGEYTVLSGSRALAVPLHLWEGRLTTHAQQDHNMLALSQYIDEQQLFTAASREKFGDAVRNGLAFESTIPQGYGAGSSGALCAAIYETYFKPVVQTDMHNARKSLAQLENHFHGTSSGMDPLVSLMNTPVLRELETYHLLPGFTLPEDIQVMLIDSGKQRSTEQLVKQYGQWTEEGDFKIHCLRHLVQSVDHAIGFFIDLHITAFWDHLKVISALQFRYFKPMIADSIVKPWQSSLSNHDIAIKLCGAGGGGYYLGFALKSVNLQAFFGEELRIMKI